MTVKQDDVSSLTVWGPARCRATLFTFCDESGQRMCFLSSLRRISAFDAFFRFKMRSVSRVFECDICQTMQRN